MKPLNEDHLLVAIDYFIDFANNVFLLGYDLRIDAYSYCQFPFYFHYEGFKYNSIYRIQKNVIESQADARVSRQQLSTHYQLNTLSPKDLNPIEEIYYTNYNKKQTTILSDETENPYQLRIFLGQIVEIKQVDSVLGKSLDLKIKCDNYPEVIITRSLDNTYKPTDPVVCLVKTQHSSQGDSYTVLGLKPKDEINLYQNSEYLDLKNRQIKWVDYR